VDERVSVASMADRVAPTATVVAELRVSTPSVAVRVAVIAAVVAPKYQLFDTSTSASEEIDFLNAEGLNRPLFSKPFEEVAIFIPELD
jgi:hypothetical protein